MRVDATVISILRQVEQGNLTSTTAHSMGHLVYAVVLEVDLTPINLI